jgi:hypothetical protein
VQITQKIIKAYSDCQLIAFTITRFGYLVLPKANNFCQLIAFAVTRFGYLGKPKAFQKNALHPFGFFNTR